MAVKKVVKRVGLVVLAIIVVIAVALGIFISTFDINKYKPTIEQKVSEAVGYNLKIDGDLGLTIFPAIAIEVKGLHLENPEKFQAQALDFAYVEKANVGLALRPLLSKQLEFKDITLNGVSLNLVKPKDGAPNWDLNANKKQVKAIEQNTNVSPSATQAAKSGDSHVKIVALLNSMSFNQVAVKDTTVTYYDVTVGKTQAFDNINFTCGPFDDTSKPLQFDFSANFNKTPLTVKGQLTSLEGIFDGAVPFNVEAGFDKLKANVEGKLALAGDPMLEATARVPAFNPKEVLRALLPSVPNIVAKAGAGAFASLETNQKITISSKKAINFAGPFTFDQTNGNVSGSFSSRDGGQTLVLNLDGNQINLNTYLAGTGAASDKATASSSAVVGSGSSGAIKGLPAPNTIFSRGALAKMNLTVDIKLNQATYQDIIISGLTANAKLNKGSADAVCAGKITTGQLSGSVAGTYNNQNNRHNASIEADIPELNLDSLMGGNQKTAAGPASGSTATGSPAPAVAKKPFLDPQIFGQLNVAAKVKLNKLIFQGMTFSGVNLNAKLNQGATDARFSANYGNVPLNGNFSGNLTAQNSTKKIVFKTSGLPIAPLLKALADKDMLEGALTADVNVSGTGMDLDDFKRSLTGTVMATVDRGQIKAGNIALPFDQIWVDMAFSQGKGDFNKGQLTGNTVAATFGGWVNLANDTLDVAVRPTLLPVDAVNALLGAWLPATALKLPNNVPFRVSGPFAKPNISLDVTVEDIVDVIKSDEFREGIKSLDPKNLEESLKQGVQNQLDEALPGAGDLLEGLFGGKKKTGDKAAESTTGTTPTAEQGAASDVKNTAPGDKPKTVEDAAKDAAGKLLKNLLK